MKISSQDKKIVVYAVDKHHPHGKENLIFDREAVGEHAETLPFLYEECLKRGIQLVTPDIYFSLLKQPGQAVFVMDGTDTGHVRELVKTGLRAAVIIVVESPIYCCRFFYNLERETALFDHSLLPKGAGPHVSPKTKFHPYIPVQLFTGKEHVDANFEKKKFLTLIAGNKRVHKLKRLYVHVMNFLNPFPSFVDRELCYDRLEAIRHFSNNPGFDLYGYGWDQPVRYGNKRYKEGIRRSYRGIIKAKLPVLQQYKFSICFENSIFDGYVTEKIIDSLFAGCVPVYWGAPDVTDYIPKSCFIDFRDFKDYVELELFLKNMDKRTYNTYIENINAFIASENYHKYFGMGKFAENMIEIFESYF